MKTPNENLPKFLYRNCEGLIAVGVHGDSVVEDEWNEWIAQQELSPRWIPVVERLPEDKYMKRITLCGSTKFKREFEALNKQLTLEGNLVYSVAFFGHADNIPMTDEQKQLVDKVHKAKIDNSDAILVIDVDGYIGESTRSEIRHAEQSGKVVRYLSDFPDLVCMCDSITMADAFAEPLHDKPIINPPSGEK